MFKTTLIAFCLTLTAAAFAQTADEIKLAQQYMSNGEYEKAKDIYERMYDANPTVTNYKYLSNCYLALLDYKSIEKLIGKQQKKYPDNLTLYVDLGVCYKKQENFAKQREVYNTAISKITDNRNQVVQLANAFMGADENEYAILAYQKGKEKVTSYLFNYELANLYFRKGEKKVSMQTFLDYMIEPDANIQNAYNGIQRMLGTEADHQLLQELTYERIQKNDAPVYSELLIWDFTQLKDYDGAFLQAKALDKRYKENGKRVYELAEIAKNEYDYDAAIKCYQYIVDAKSKESPYYYNAKSAILTCRRLKIEETNYYTQKDIEELKKYYLDFIQEYGKKDNKSADVLREYARLEALYSYRVDSAINILEDVVTWPLINAQNRSQAKLDLGDYYLVSGDVWEATLLYSQVDKAMKDEPLGEEARFKNAKLAYYRGDFNLAQGQMEVLKAATSELVANDALELSVFITDNLGLDSVLEPMNLFAQAELYVFQNKIPQAIETLKLLSKKYPAHKLTDDIEFMRYKIELKQNNIDSAIVHLENIRQNYAYDLLADDAIFKLGEIYQYFKKDFESAKLCYEQIILQYNSSLYVNEARKRFRELRGDKL
ncbi:MAG: tetratricopeptide repeat protein [Chitinophagales bacterium]